MSSFEDFDFDKELLRCIYAYGHERPDTSQQQILDLTRQNRDTIVLGNIGSDSRDLITSVTSLSKINPKQNICQALILLPSREACWQFQRSLTSFGEYIDFRSHVCTAGNAIRDDIDTLKGGSHVVIGTPGRIQVLIARKFIDPSALKLLILHDLDELISRGFYDLITCIKDTFSSPPLVVIYTTTSSSEIVELVEELTPNPVWVTLASPKPSFDGIKQYHIAVDTEAEKIDALNKFIVDLDITQAIVLTDNTNRAAQAFEEHNPNISFMVDSINHDLHDTSFKKFRSGDVRLVFTHSPAKIDAYFSRVSCVALVIILDLPDQVEEYASLTGPGGRFGRKRVVISILAPSDCEKTRKIRKHYAIEIPELPGNAKDIL